jgi:Response regulator containing CheY-like receiver domain and AraC-type DNA-binding domain
MNKIKVLIADDIEETRNVIKKILNLEKEFFEIVGEASNGEEALKLIYKVKPDVVLMDINMPVLNGLEATERICSEYPSVIVIIMSVQAENEYLKKAMFYGAKEYIIKPFNYDVLVSTIKITYEKYKKRIESESVSTDQLKNAKIITFFSSKGGVGKSVIALNSSITLSKKFNKKILLVDMNLQFGDMSMLMNKYTEKNILDAIEDRQYENYEDIKTYLYQYNDKLHMLFAPKKPEAAEYISKDLVEKIIDVLKNHYDLILVDTGINFNDSTLHILDISEMILLISTMELVALKNTKLGLGVMQSLGYDKNKVKIVINKVAYNYGINKNDIETVFKDMIISMVPEDIKNVSVSINTGEPFCGNDKFNKLKINKAIEELCTHLSSLD